MRSDIDWTLATFEGARRRQLEEFRALPLRRKLELLEEMGAVADFFASRRAKREAAKREQSSCDIPAQA